MDKKSLKFSIVHPTRNRLKMCEQAVNNWISNFSFIEKDKLEYILSLDYSDKELDNYKQLAKKHLLSITINDNTCCVEAANNGAKLATGDIIILVSDDFYSFEGWNLELKKLFKENTPQIFQINDSITKDIITLPIMTMKAYKELNYIYYPEYKSIYADNDLRLVAEVKNYLVDATHLVFKHKHWINGCVKKDEQYEHQEKLENWKIGREVFERRRRELNLINGYRYN